MKSTILTPLSIEFHGLVFAGPVILLVPMIVATIYFSISSFVWLYRDAEQRGKKGWTALVLILLTGWPISFLWWFWLRPKGERHQIDWKLLRSSPNRRGDSGRTLVYVQGRVTFSRRDCSGHVNEYTITSQKALRGCQTLFQ
jgi:hypothetical protein